MDLPVPLSLELAASWLGASFSSRTDANILGLNEIHMVRPGDLTFVDHPKYYKKVLQSPATFIIINQNINVPEGKALIFSDDPFRDYNLLVRRFRCFESCSAHISPSATIGEGTVIQPGAFVGNHVSIGRNCIIHANVSIYDHCIIGNEVIIHSNTVIGADAFYFKRRPGRTDKLESCGNVVIEDDVEIGAGCTIDRGVSGDTIIGQGTRLDNQVQIGHDTRIGRFCLLAAQVGVAGVCVVEDDVILWGQVGVQKDLRIGRGAIVLGQSGVARDLEAGKIYFGSPCKEASTHKRELVLMKELPLLVRSLRSQKAGYNEA
jgi:UDP-3-O-[3-hydroxymyristoyl] glucosamine N-acyltransferase